MKIVWIKGKVNSTSASESGYEIFIEEEKTGMVFSISSEEIENSSTFEAPQRLQGLEGKTVFFESGRLRV